MAKAKNKTTENENSVIDFIESIIPEQRKEDALKLLNTLNDLLPETPKMWGASIIGYGNYHYKYDSGREGDFMKVGFSPRKTSLTIYIISGFEKYEKLLSRLGKHKTGKSCLYIKKLEEIDLEILKKMIKSSYDYMTEKYG